MTTKEIKAILDDHEKWLQGIGGARADLTRADLCEADLSKANLGWADLSEADLTRSDLYGADLKSANLYGANLYETCLDPNASPNADVGDYKIEGGYVIGYRTRQAGHIDRYRDGRFYSADWFSVADTKCHPGLYLWPTLRMATNWAPGQEIIRVRTQPSEVHRAGGKWRCRWFEVLGRQEI